MSKSPNRKEYGPLSLTLFSFMTGIVAGCGAFVFRALIAFFHNLFFNGTLSPLFDANVHGAASPWGALVMLVPAVGAVGVVYLVKNLIALSIGDLEKCAPIY